MLLNDSWKVLVCPPSKLDENWEVNDEVDKDLEKEKVVKEVENEVKEVGKEVESCILEDFCYAESQLISDSTHSLQLSPNNTKVDYGQ